MPKYKPTKKEETELNQVRKNIRAGILKQYRSIETFCWENELPKSSVNDLLTGKNNPTYMLLMRIRDALGITMSELTGY